MWHQIAVRMRIIWYAARYGIPVYRYGTILPLGNSSLLLRCIYYAEGFIIMHDTYTSEGCKRKIIKKRTQ